MADVVLDANVLIAHFDQHDSLHERASAVMQGLRVGGHNAQLLDFVMNEVVSVLCRRAAQRSTNPPELAAILSKILVLYDDGEIEFLPSQIEQRFRSIIEIVRESSGRLNFNDATLCVLQRHAVIGEVATFDQELARYPGFRAWA
jgi:predicted nucleic acid-binding protein